MKHANDNSLSAEYLRSILDYDPESGVFVWKHRADRNVQWNTRWPGQMAGRVAGDGYRQIQINGKLCMASRLAFLYVHGFHPPAEIDHKNRIRDDNRIANLRPAERWQNQVNKGTPGTNTSGFQGIVRHKQSGKWQAQIRYNGRRHYLGLFTDLADACTTYCDAARVLHGDFSNAANDNSRAKVAA